ncbi:hypothetical protein TUM20983_36660 [Mycobacterium antarcticum]|uniref:DUF5701 family protein n=1 Tax=Mycolicibacterium sp. TUM20983 TaxID=3023369 RepID=UPI002395057C|nr:DUF5701 family protein [Mycolicibacterium sp. TUM20983]GLP76556.1 hypothetical protein TUM20983_36660 [Mycolicibacterium sp. TUM20983]
MATVASPLLSPIAQADRLVGLDVHRHAGLSASRLRAIAAGAAVQSGLLVVHPKLVPASHLAPLIRHSGKSGFVVTDMSDVDEFESVVPLPDSPVYLVEDVDRGDGYANWSPNEVDRDLTAAGRTPLTLTEGLTWLLQQPAALQRNHCFMTIGSRKRKPGGALDTRTPAIWISNGTGRDGSANRNAPKIGWCWAGNRHTWLGFGSSSGRRPLASEIA